MMWPSPFEGKDRPAIVVRLRRIKTRILFLRWHNINERVAAIQPWGMIDRLEGNRPEYCGQWYLTPMP